MALFFVAAGSASANVTAAQSGANFNYVAPGASVAWSSYAYYDPNGRVGLGADKRLSAGYRIYPWQRLTNIRVPEDSFFFSKSLRNRLNHSITRIMLALQRHSQMILLTSQRELMKV